MVTAPAALRSALARVAAWRRDVSGVAIVEFALVLPVMLIMLLGLTEVTSAVNVDRKLTILARSLADLTARVPKVTTADMTSIFSAASAVMQPYDATTAQMVVSSVKVVKTGSTYTGEVQWSCGKNIATKPAGAPADWDTGYVKPRVTNSSYAVPSGFESAKSFIVVETVLPYKPLLGYVVTSTINLTEVTPWPVRNVDYVELSGGCPA